MNARRLLFCNVTERAKLCLRGSLSGVGGAWPVIGAGVVFRDAPTAPHARRIVPSYDPFTRRLVQMSADQNGDGRFDQWTFLDGNRPLRGEADADGDGRIDRWEYFDTGSVLVSVGTSSLNDGIEDTWTFAAANAQGETRDRAIAKARSAMGSRRVRSRHRAGANRRRHQRDGRAGSLGPIRRQGVARGGVRHDAAARPPQSAARLRRRRTFRGH